MKNNTLNFSGVSRDTWVRIILLALSLINMVLNRFGITYFTNEDINAWYDVVSVFVACAASVWCTWKNNSFTFNAQNADKFLHDLKNNITDVYGE